MYTLEVENAMDPESVLAVDTHLVLVDIGTDGASVNLGVCGGKCKMLCPGCSGAGVTLID